MKTLVYVMFFIFSSNSLSLAQNHHVFDIIPIDTTKWVVTDSIFVDFNNDGNTDVLLVFDKYRSLYRPDNIQTPVLFYLGMKNKDFVYFDKSEKLICLPSYEITTKNNIIIVTQKGVRDDRNIYTIHLKYENGEIVICKEVIVKVIKKSKINEETGDVITSFLKKDTVYNKSINISLKKFDFLDMLNKGY
jgi:hypothetical protein